jgi:hypothetical protein
MQLFTIQRLNRPAGVHPAVDFMVMISVFVSSYVFFKQPFEFYLHYIFYLTLIPLFALKYGYPKYAAQILLITLVLGLIDVSLDYCDAFQFVKTWGGLFLSVTFYSFVLRYYNYDLKYLFERYLQWSFYMVLISIIQLVSFVIKFQPGYDFRWILNKWSFNLGGLTGVRLNGIFSEPSTLGVVLAPAVYVACYNIIHKQNYILSKPQSMAILFVYLASGSSTAYIGLLIILVLITESFRIRYIAIGGVAVFFLSTVLYNNVEEFRIRVDTSYELWVNQNYAIENTNSSSFVLYNNANVAGAAIKEHPIFGTGLGSYNYAYEKHSLTKTVLEYDFEFNTTDGNSMLIRMLVEVGLLGSVLFILLLFRAYIGSAARDEYMLYRIISQSILIMILLYLLRQGNYYLNALPLFVMMYYFNWRQFTIRKRKDEQEKLLDVAENKVE